MAASFKMALNGFKMALDGKNLMSPALVHQLDASSQGARVVERALACSQVITDVTSQSDLARSVYCILGMPIDAVNTSAIVSRIEAAAASRAVLLISTPNLNFLVSSLSDPEFRESVLNSDLCSPDGAPIVWIARLLGVPIKERAAGSDFLDQLKIGTRARRLKIFLFGGAKGIAAAAAKKINAAQDGLFCVGTMDPGFCEVSEMSQDTVIDAINASGADFLSVSLGAKKGQLWLHRNHLRLTIPVRVHLGAVINFQAGIIKRAPLMMRAWGLEWLWRIKEEHCLWKRYLNDGTTLIILLLTRILPLIALTRWYQLRRNDAREDLLVEKSQNDQSIVIGLRGTASEPFVSKAIACFQGALTENQNITIDLSNTRYVDARFLGLLLMLRKELRRRGGKLTFIAAPPTIERIFRLSELRFLLSPD
jgi:N-acetylglucosaminyldiphosphoundecaprenol N-acetyl-beta-D-mannosaminyltransferase